MVDKIKKILVPLDGSKNSFRGLDKAIALARPSDAEIKVVYVRPTPPIFAKLIKPMYTEALGEDEIFLDLAKKRAERNGVKLTIKVTEFEKPGEYIVNLAQKQGHDLIVIGARGIGSVREFFLGSVSNYITHKSKIPTLIVK